MDDVLKQAAARVGAVLKGKWRLDALLGCGGMAAVYRATHRNGNEVAVKMLHPHLSMNRDVRERFLREGYLANKVRHRGAVIVQDDDVSDDGVAFLVMELLEGETLENRRVRLGGKLPAEEVLRLAEQLLDVLVRAHEQGIIHRDLKPENLFVTNEGGLKVLDFGIARLRELSGASSATQTGSLLGTPAYMAPEQARGRWKDVDHTTDLWAVGATMYTTLSGRAVHEAETASETLALAVTSPASPIQHVLPDVDPTIAAIIDRSLRYDKRERFETAASMLEAVRAVLAGAGLGPREEISALTPAPLGPSPLGPLPPVPLPPVPLGPVVARAATAESSPQPIPPIVGGKTTMTPGSMELTTTARTQPKRVSVFRRAGLEPPKLMVVLIAAGAFLVGLFVLVGTLVATQVGKKDDAVQANEAPSAGSELGGAPTLEPVPSVVPAVPAPDVVPSAAPPEASPPKPTSSASKPVKPPKATPKVPTKQPIPKPTKSNQDPWDIRGK